MSDIQNALVQAERYIRLEENEKLLGRQGAVAFREPNEETKEQKRLLNPIRQRDRREDYQIGEGRFKKARIVRDFIEPNCEADLAGE